jgi:hypothetical protein
MGGLLTQVYVTFLLTVKLYFMKPVTKIEARYNDAARYLSALDLASR